MTRAHVIDATSVIIRYRSGTRLVPIGVIMHIPSVESLHLNFRDDLSIILRSDHEAVSNFGASVVTSANELGAATTFAWVVSFVSRELVIDDPITIEVTNIDAVLNVLEDTVNELKM